MRPLAAVALFLLSSLPLFGQQATLFPRIVLGTSGDVTAGAHPWWEIEVGNISTTPAANARVTLDVPPEVTVESIPQLYGCDLAARPVRCFAGTIEGAGTRTYRITVGSPRVEGTFTVRATFEADNAVPVSLDLTFGTRFRTQLSAAIEPPRRVEPGTPLVFRTSVSNGVTELPAKSVRVDFTVTGANITAIETDPSWSCVFGGTIGQCVIPLLDPSCDDCQNLVVHTAAADDAPAGRIVELTMRVSSDYEELLPEDNFRRSRIEVYRHIFVTTTADAGEGSLRNAIELANQGCNEIPCVIGFNIPAPVPAEGWFTIIPSTPLPPVTARYVILDGSSQTRFSGQTNPLGPEIAIDGRLAGRGLEMHAACEGVVDGLAIGNFMENQGLWYENPRVPCREMPYDVDRRRVSGNYIGTDPTGTVAWPNLRGLRLDFSSAATVSENVISGNRFSGVWMWTGSTLFRLNRIGTTADGISPLPNGASGIFLGPDATADVYGNTISFHPHMGIAIARGPQEVAIAGNSMRNNAGLGIDWGLDGVSRNDTDDTHGPTNAPTLLSASYDAASGQTMVTLAWRTTRFEVFGGNQYELHFYANATPDGDGEEPVDTIVNVDVSRVDGNAFRVAIPGDHRGKWLNATGTRRNFMTLSRPPRSTKSEDVFTGDVRRTSELSNAVKVE
jgi:hypothetical protein